MTFTLVSYLRDELATLVRVRAERREREEREKERLALEVPSIFHIRVSTPIHHFANRQKKPRLGVLL